MGRGAHDVLLQTIQTSVVNSILFCDQDLPQ